MSAFPQGQHTSPEGQTRPGFDPQTKRMLVSLEARIRNLENILNNRFDSIDKDSVQNLRAKWGELISNA